MKLPFFRSIAVVVCVSVTMVFTVHTAAAQGLSACLGDIDGDEKVDLSDYSILMQGFLKDPVVNPAADLTHDGKVDLSDYGAFVSRFLKPCVLVTGGVTESVASPTSVQVSPTAVPTATLPPTQPTVTPVSAGGGNNLYASSYSVWDPADPKNAAAGPQKYPTCSKAFHDTFKILASDGKWYPTWHPPVAVDPSTGVKCSFGHEHGLDPSKSYLWPQIKQHFYYDANKNGVMDSSEEAVAGLPFGFANEQLDAYFTSKGIPSMRHEDHVGNKVAYVNGEADTDGGSFGTSTTGGIVIPIQKVDPATGFKWTDSGVKCYYLTKLHQGVHSPDAFTNNLHEVIFFADCHGPNASYDQKAAVSVIAQFGAAGEFINGCDAGGDRTTPVVVGKDSNNQYWPGTRGNGFRIINQRACDEQYFLVPQGKYSMNAYEAWSTSLKLSTATGKTLMSDVNLTLDVEDSIRYYYPTHPNNLGYNMDLCYEVLPNGNKARGGSCDTVTNYGKIKDITWNDVRSGFKGIHRGMYYQGPRMSNSGGSEVIYTDPFGGNAQNTPFTGSVKQNISAKDVRYGDFGVIDPRQMDQVFDNGEGTVHAPN